MRKRAINYEDDVDKSDPEDSGTEYDKVAVLGFQVASKRKKKEEDFQKERKSNRHKSKSKLQKVIDTSETNSINLSVNNSLDGFSSSPHWLGADIYIVASISQKKYAQKPICCHSSNPPLLR